MVVIGCNVMWGIACLLITFAASERFPSSVTDTATFNGESVSFNLKTDTSSALVASRGRHAHVANDASGASFVIWVDEFSDFATSAQSVVEYVLSHQDWATECSSFVQSLAIPHPPNAIEVYNINATMLEAIISLPHVLGATPIPTSAKLTPDLRCTTPTDSDPTDSTTGVPYSVKLRAILLSDDLLALPDATRARRAADAATATSSCPTAMPPISALAGAAAGGAGGTTTNTSTYVATVSAWERYTVVFECSPSSAAWSPLSPSAVCDCAAAVAASPRVLRVEPHGASGRGRTQSLWARGSLQSGHAAGGHTLCDGAPTVCDATIAAAASCVATSVAGPAPGCSAAVATVALAGGPASAAVPIGASSPNLNAGAAGAASLNARTGGFAVAGGHVAQRVVAAVAARAAASAAADADDAPHPRDSTSDDGQLTDAAAVAAAAAAVYGARDGLTATDTNHGPGPVHPSPRPVLRASFEPFSAAGLTGKGHVVGCGDTGVDADHCFFHDDKEEIPYGRHSATHRKIVAYWTLDSSASGRGDSEEGHGTHVAGLIAGTMPSMPDGWIAALKAASAARSASAAATNASIDAYGPAPSEVADDSRAAPRPGAGAAADPTASSDVAGGDMRYMHGIVPSARLAISDLAGMGGTVDSLTLPTDLTGIFTRHRDSGAVVDTHSWGSTSLSYDAHARQSDDWINTHREAVLFFAAGNEGDRVCKNRPSEHDCDTYTIITPALAKNVIAVGAAVAPPGSWTFFGHAAAHMIVTPPGSAATRYRVARALFGARWSVPVDAVLHFPPESDTAMTACADTLVPQLPKSDDGAPAVYVVKRGTCKFLDKVRRAAAAGAVAVVCINNIPGDAFSAGNDFGSNTTVPMFMVSDVDGAAILTTWAAAKAAAGQQRLRVRIPTAPQVEDWRRTGHTLSLFSSRGPTKDGRHKPELVAIGEYAHSAYSDGKLSSRNCDWLFQMGTSMATPQIAGLAVVVREYFIRGFAPCGKEGCVDAVARNPSGVLVKAVLLAAAVPLDGGVDQNSQGAWRRLEPTPSFQQGWGQPVLASMLPIGTSHPLVNQVAFFDDMNITASAAVSYCIRYSAAPPGGAFSATLVWNDPAGDPTSSGLASDLNLFVRPIGPSGATASDTGHGSTVTHPVWDAATFGTCATVAAASRMWPMLPMLRGGVDAAADGLASGDSFRTRGATGGAAAIAAVDGDGDGLVDDVVYAGNWRGGSPVAHMDVRNNVEKVVFDRTASHAARRGLFLVTVEAARAPPQVAVRYALVTKGTVVDLAVCSAAAARGTPAHAAATAPTVTGVEAYGWTPDTLRGALGWSAAPGTAVLHGTNGCPPGRHGAACTGVVIDATPRVGAPLRDFSQRGAVGGGDLDATSRCSLRGASAAAGWAPGSAASLVPYCCGACTAGSTSVVSTVTGGVELRGTRADPVAAAAVTGRVVLTRLAGVSAESLAYVRGAAVRVHDAEVHGWTYAAAVFTHIRPVETVTVTVLREDTMSDPDVYVDVGRLPTRASRLSERTCDMCRGATSLVPRSVTVPQSTIPTATPSDPVVVYAGVQVACCYRSNYSLSFTATFRMQRTAPAVTAVSVVSIPAAPSPGSVVPVHVALAGGHVLPLQRAVVGSEATTAVLVEGTALVDTASGEVVEVTLRRPPTGAPADAAFPPVPCVVVSAAAGYIVCLPYGARMGEYGVDASVTWFSDPATRSGEHTIPLKGEYVHMAVRFASLVPTVTGAGCLTATTAAVPIAVHVPSVAGSAPRPPVQEVPVAVPLVAGVPSPVGTVPPPSPQRTHICVMCEAVGRCHGGVRVDGTAYCLCIDDYVLEDCSGWLPAVALPAPRADAPTSAPVPAPTAPARSIAARILRPTAALAVVSVRASAASPAFSVEFRVPLSSIAATSADREADALASAAPASATHSSATARSAAAGDDDGVALSVPEAGRVAAATAVDGVWEVTVWRFAGDVGNFGRVARTLPATAVAVDDAAVFTVQLRSLGWAHTDVRGLAHVALYRLDGEFGLPTATVLALRDVTVDETAAPQRPSGVLDDLFGESMDDVSTKRRLLGALSAVVVATVAVLGCIFIRNSRQRKHRRLYGSRLAGDDDMDEFTILDRSDTDGLTDSDVSDGGAPVSPFVR